MIVELIYLIHLISCLPIYYKTIKDRVYVLAKNGVPKWLDYTINIVLMIILSGLKMDPKLKPDDIMNFNGAVTCFFTVYLIPILLHLNCYHGVVGFVKGARSLAIRSHIMSSS